ncbi:TIGR02099 family protein [Aromatoleum toluvorans]|uniref:TIGR02099 family protein n=1 Tax=Aromatoleum toluvorans TaxID=92002 RepID=A0ABX1Q0T5_9RHOO|nr:YhdP family protein [Aromatoleum toluvorans]NMG44472.1 TIGR02099 family protein [Aromatoleum toluvorans]
MISSARRGRVWRVLSVALLAAWFVLGTGFLLVREVLVPRVGEFRQELADAISVAAGLPVSIEGLSADLRGLRPRLHLAGFELKDREGRPALHLDSIDATLSWWSLLRAEPHFHRIEVKSPVLALRRDVDGAIYIAGIRIDPEQTADRSFADWLFAQREIVIRDASLGWTDAMRGAPELNLAGVQFRLLRSGPRYRFAFRAQAPAELAPMIEVRGDLASRAPADPSSWMGQVYVAADEASLGGWRTWIDYPVALAGRGGVRAWMGLDEGRLDSLAVNLALADVNARLGDDLPVLELASVRGRLVGRRTAEGMAFSARGLELATMDGLAIAPTDLDLSLHGADGGPPDAGKFTSGRLDFRVLSSLAAHLPFDPAVRQRIGAFAPQGTLDELRLEWRGALDKLEAWKIRTRFAGIGLNPQGAVPGLAGMSGEIEGDERAGRFRIAGQDAALELPAVFPESRIGFSNLRADGRWTHGADGRLEIALDSANFDNPDAAGTASGRYWPAAGSAGEIDLSARLTRAESGAVWRYLPHVVNDDTRTWLRHGIVGGRVPDARLRLKGKLDDFPFRNGKSGQFLVTTRVFGARLDYAEGWPSITNIDGEVRFEGPGMRITADRARIFGVALANVVADVPDLDAPGGEIMSIHGRAAGPTADFLRFVSESPVSRRINGFTDAMRAEGTGALDLKLVLPLRRMDTSTVKGEYRFTANRVNVVDGLPPLTEASGVVRFTENDLAIPEARARLYGEPMQLVASTAKDGGVVFDASGGMKVQALREAHDLPGLDHLSGGAEWKANIDTRAQGTRVVVDSNLIGVASSLPQPMNKSATATWPLRVTLDFPAGGKSESVRVALDGRGELQLERRRAGDGWGAARGGMGLQAAAPNSDAGVAIAAKLDELDVDAWRKVFDAAKSSGGADRRGPIAVAAVDLRAQRLSGFGHELADAHLSARADDGGWRGRIESREVEGDFEWRDSGDGTLRARLKRLVLGGSHDAATEAAASADAAAETDEAPRRLPALDVVVDRFSLRGMEFGRLELQAQNQGGMWHLDAVSLANADGRLGGSGLWRPGVRPQTDLDFRLEARDIGLLAKRLGYGEAVRGGKAVLTGKVAWRGAPTRIHYPSLTGTMTIEAENGQFRRLDPGVGRLLGVLSLQALPRRLTLDFRDVFSEGFAFDSISGSIKAAAGQLRTDDLRIRGPAARVRMSGSVDIEDETQDLRVTVQPTLSESVAIGTAAGLINPVAGVVAYVAQKALSDPIEKMFAFSYAVTGNWADPKVEKLTAAPGTAASSKQE